MALPMPEGYQITIEHRHLPAGYCMPSMEMAADHYNIGYTVSGDRQNITPLQTYSYHAGDVSMAPPHLYHRTIAVTDIPYDSYLIKFTPEFIEPFLDHVGQHFFDELYELKICRFHKSSQKKILNMFCEMEKEYQKKLPYTEFILQGMLFRLLTTVWEERLLNEKAIMNKSPLTKPVIDAIFHMETHYSQNLTLEKTAHAVNLSPAYLSRLFRAQLDMSFSEYLINIKMRHVKILLSQSSKSITEIAQETGFCSSDYLSTQFKSKTGMTPKEFRRNSK